MLLYNNALVSWPIAQPVTNDSNLMLLAPLNIKNAPKRNNATPKVGPAHASNRDQNSPLTSIGTTPS